MTGQAIATPANHRQINVNQLYPRWLTEWENNRPFCLIDVRTADEFSIGHVPGVRLIPLDSLMEKGAEMPGGGYQTFTTGRVGQYPELMVDELAFPLS